MFRCNDRVGVLDNNELQAIGIVMDDEPVLGIYLQKLRNVAIGLETKLIEEDRLRDAKTTAHLIDAKKSWHYEKINELFEMLLELYPPTPERKNDE